MEREKGGRMEGKKVERWKVGMEKGGKMEREKGGKYYTILYYAILAVRS